MADWLYTLQVKDLLVSGKGEDFDYDAHAVEIAGTIRDRIRELAEKAEQSPAFMKRRQGDDFADELSDLVDRFDEVVDANPEHCRDGAAAMLNDALSELYDVGDEGHRIWIK